MPQWVEFVALLKLVFGLLLPAGLTLECIVISEARSKEVASHSSPLSVFALSGSVIGSCVASFLTFFLLGRCPVPIWSELEVCILAWLFLPQCNGFCKLCEKWRLSVGAVRKTPTPEDECNTSTLIDYLSEEIKTILRRKVEEVRLARLSGNVFEARVREKRLKNATSRVQSLTGKLNKEHNEQDTLCKFKSKSTKINPRLTSFAHRQQLVKQAIPE
eukprot:g7531.t1